MKANPKSEERIDKPARRRADEAVSPSLRLSVSFVLLAIVLCCSARAQTYSIDWNTIDGGGGTSTNSQYSLSGTIGQPEAGLMSGGPFTVQGGFWGVLAAVQTPGAPSLTIARTVTNTVVVSWPATNIGWVLQRTNALPSAPSVVWPQVPPPYQTNGGAISVTFTNSPDTSSQFFRLHKP